MTDQIINPERHRVQMRLSKARQYLNVDEPNLGEKENGPVRGSLDLVKKSRARMLHSSS